MSSPSATLIDRLSASVEAHASLSLFKVPQDVSLGITTSWTDITYRQYFSDVEYAARYLTAQLKLHHVPKGSIVGLWFGGVQYDDFVCLVALKRAGYIPQLFSLAYTSPEIVFELTHKSGALALIHDPSFNLILNQAPVPVIPTGCLKDIIASVDTSSSPIILPDNLFDDEDNLAFMYHTSGSTSGSPKLVPFSHKFLRDMARKVLCLLSEGRKTVGGRYIIPPLGSVAHAGTLYQFLAMVQTGGCMVLPSSIKYTTEELLNMARECSVTHILRYTPLVDATLREAQSNPTLMKTLHSLSGLCYGGLQLSEKLVDWAFDNKIPLLNTYASTEGGLLMTSTIDKHARYLKVIQGIIHRFEPVDDRPALEDKGTGRLCEFVILPGSPDMPDPSLVGPSGVYRTGDLFEEAKGLENMWVFRGRGDDWIKNEMSMKCDTRDIEESLRETCGDLIDDCVVVGNTRPCPAIIVESAKSGLSNEQRNALQEEIIQRMSQFNMRRLNHERVTDPRLIYVLDGDKLPRTTAKGNVRRKATEEHYKDQLSAMYSSIN